MTGQCGQAFILQETRAVFVQKEPLIISNIESINKSGIINISVNDCQIEVEGLVPGKQEILYLYKNSEEQNKLIINVTEFEYSCIKSSQNLRAFNGDMVFSLAQKFDSNTGEMSFECKFFCLAFEYIERIIGIDGLQQQYLSRANNHNNGIIDWRNFNDFFLPNEGQNYFNAMTRIGHYLEFGYNAFMIKLHELEGLRKMVRRIYDKRIQIINSIESNGGFADKGHKDTANHWKFLQETLDKL
jgi:hypothetical protein